MDKMKQLVMVIIGFVVAALVAALLLNSTKNDLQRTTTAITAESTVITTDDIDQDLLFLSIYEWQGYDSRLSGYVVDKNGKRYDFDFSAIGNASPEQVFKEAQHSLSSLESSNFISVDDMPNLYTFIYRVNAESSFDEEVSENGMGTTTLYAVTYHDGDLQLVKIYSYGEVKATPHDAAARSIRKFFEEKRTS